MRQSGATARSGKAVNGRADCFAVRRLNPFQGMLQVVEVPDARALSLDGVQWEIQVRCAQPEHTWRSANRSEPVMRFWRFGVWTRASGHGKVPLSPLWDMDLVLRASAELTQVLPECLDALPFAAADRHEMWLLDATGSPVALLASRIRAPTGEPIGPEPWAATALCEHGFRSPALLARGIPQHTDQDPRHHASLLERLVRNAGGHPARTRWVERGGDSWVSSKRLDGGLQREGVRRSPTADSLPLLLWEDWSDAEDRDLVADYLSWCAPYLLMLSGLDDDIRDRYEHAAKARALEVEVVHRLYPKVLNPGLLESILVEARLRRASSS